MRRVWHRDLVLAALTLVLAVFYLGAAAEIPESALSDNVGASGFPNLIGWGLIIASTALVLRTLLTAPGGEGPGTSAPAAGDGDDVWATPRRTALRAAGLAAIAAAFLLLLPWTGYLVAVAAMILAVALYQGRRPSVVVLGVAAGGAAVLFALFVLLLDIPLPRGLWWRALF